MSEIEHWIVDYLNLAKGQSRAFIHREPPKEYLRYVVEGKPPVILLPGIAEKWTFMKDLGDDISKRGHKVYIVPELGYNLKDIPTSAGVVRKLVDENDLQDVLLVGHSKGGLIGKYLLINNNSDKRIKGLVAVAAPFSGAELAHVIPHYAYKELTPKSRVIHDLESNPHVNSHIVSIFPVYDNLIRSKDSSRLEGSQNVVVDVKGHHKILFSKELLVQVEKSIESLSKKD